MANVTQLTSSTTARPVPTSEELQLQILTEEKVRCFSEHNETIHGPGGLGPLNGGCRPIWDGMMCWKGAEANSTVFQPCPSYVLGVVKHEENATKFCNESGLWYSNNENQTSWTNYTMCFPKQDTTIIINVSFKALPTEKYIVPIRTVAEVGYALSLISLLLAFIIFASIKKLRCPRNVLHMHLFASFIMRAFMTLLKFSLFRIGVGRDEDIVILEGVEYFNSESQVNWHCRMIVSFWQYFIMANYSWILMEGMYLHNLIFQALFTDSSSIALYIYLGWGFPIIFVIPWVICRAFLDNHYCWTMNENLPVSLLIKIPTAVSIVANSIFFVRIVVVLFFKMKASVSEETKLTKRWAKSTLFLVPLFGFQYFLLLGLQWIQSSTVEIIWLFCDQLFASFNGFFVALLYCFLNGEVRTELSKKWNQFSLERLLSRSPFGGGDHLASGILSGGGGGGGRGGRGSAGGGNDSGGGRRFLGLRFGQRHNHPRGSCYSSTSFTTVSVLPPGHCCQPTKKQRQSPDTPPPDAAPLKALVTAEEDKMAMEAKEITSNMGQDRRWSLSDYDVQNNGMELRSIISPNTYSVKM